MSIIEQSAPSAAVNQAGMTDDERAALDAAVRELHDGERVWAKTSLADRAALLRRVHGLVATSAQEWALTASSIKGLDADSPLVGEEWLSGPYAMLTGLAAVANSLEALATLRNPLDRITFGTAPGDRVTVPVMPADAAEGMLMNGFSAEVWMRPGVDGETVRAGVGLASLHPTETGGVGLVLGAGNITSIAPLDVLYELVANNRVALLKLNPTLAGMEPVYAQALAPFIQLGVLRIVQGGGPVGAYLVHHEGIAHVHITGSAATHDVIVYGPGEEGRARKKAGTPTLDKPITSELGGVSPIIVVPGEWLDSDLTFQAEHIATMRLHNGGYNCIAGQVVILSADWPQKKQFLTALRLALDEAPVRHAWYPGSDDRVAAARASYPDAEAVGPDGCRLLVDATASADVMASTEYFSPVLGVIEVPGTGQEFLDAAVATANDDLVGTLGANVLIDPKERRRLGDGFREAIARLRYGSIAINAWTGVVFLTAAATWGAFPGHTLDDVQSGRGVVHNALLLPDPERTVLTGPFRAFPHSVRHGENALFPKPPWFVSARSAALTGQRLTEYAAKPSWLKMPSVFAAAFRA